MTDFYPTSIAKKVRFNPDNGTLAVRCGDISQVFKARPPRLWLTPQQSTQWKPNRSDGLLFELGDAIRTVRKYRRRRMAAHRSDSPDNWQKDSTCQALERFVALIEPPFRHQLYNLQSRAWQVYTALYSCPGFLELCRSNQGLAFALANHWIFTGSSPKNALLVTRRLANRPRREVAEHLGFPRQEAVVRIMGKVHGRDLSLPRLIWLRRATQQPRMVRILSHLSSIEASVLDALADESAAAVCTGALMFELNQLTPSGGALLASRIPDLLSIGRVLGERVPKLASLRQVDRLHGELTKKMAIARIPVDQRLKKPPVDGIEGLIEPITSLLQVHNEGISQHNCLDTPAARQACRAGDEYFYRILAPERCTLSLRRRLSQEAGEVWEAHGFRAAANRPPGAATVKVARDWLTEVGVNAGALGRDDEEDFEELLLAMDADFPDEIDVSLIPE